jgi:hypothetical protein
VFINKKPYGIESSCYRTGPYVDIVISNGVNKETDNIVSCVARIDTGADISVVPRCYIEQLGTLILCSSVTIRGHDGSCSRLWTYKLSISLLSYPDKSDIKTFRPERGVILTNSSTALIGLDILNQLDCRFCKGVFSIV